MEFRNQKGIFQQIGDNICDRILSGELKSADKIPSVREQAANLGVNHNTIMKSYTELQRDSIIENKRGIGYFVTEKASEQIINIRRQEFFKYQMPEFIKQVGLLKISKSDLKQLIEKLEENED